MPNQETPALPTEKVVGRNVGTNKVVTLTKTQPVQLSMFQTFLPDDDQYSNTIELYDAVPKYFANMTLMATHPLKMGRRSPNHYYGAHSGCSPPSPLLLPITRQSGSGSIRQKRGICTSTSAFSIMPLCMAW